MSFDDDNMALRKRYTARVISPKGKAKKKEETTEATTAIELTTIKNKNCDYSTYTSNTSHSQLTNTGVARGLEIGVSDDITNRKRNEANNRISPGCKKGICRSGSPIDVVKSDICEVMVGTTGEITIRSHRGAHARGDGNSDTSAPGIQGDGSCHSAIPPTESLGSSGATGANAAGVSHISIYGYRTNTVKVADGTIGTPYRRSPRATNEWANAADRLGRVDATSTGEKMVNYPMAPTGSNGGPNEYAADVTKGELGTPLTSHTAMLGKLKKVHDTEGYHRSLDSLPYLRKKMAGGSAAPAKPVGTLDGYLTTNCHSGSHVRGFHGSEQIPFSDGKTIIPCAYKARDSTIFSYPKRYRKLLTGRPGGLPFQGGTNGQPTGMCSPGLDIRKQNKLDPRIKAVVPNMGPGEIHTLKGGGYCGQKHIFSRRSGSTVGSKCTDANWTVSGKA